MAKMTRAHFQFIADVLAAMPEHAANLRAAKLSAMTQFADSLRSTNPNFNREKFLSACGYDGLHERIFNV